MNKDRLRFQRDQLVHALRSAKSPSEVKLLKKYIDILEEQLTRQEDEKN